MTRPPRIPRDPVAVKQTPSERSKRSVPSHLRFIRTLPCAIRKNCGYLKSEAAHVRGGTDGGAGLKPSDKWTVPLCAVHHRIQHHKGEAAFWTEHRIDPVSLAERLWRISGDHDQALRAIERARGVEKIG